MDIVSNYNNVLNTFMQSSSQNTIQWRTVTRHLDVLMSMLIAYSILGDDQMSRRMTSNYFDQIRYACIIAYTKQSTDMNCLYIKSS